MILLCCFAINFDKTDILDRTLLDAAAERRPSDEDWTSNQARNHETKEPLSGMTSSCESVATAVGVAKRALCQSADLLRDLDSLLSTQAADT